MKPILLAVVFISSFTLAALAVDPAPTEQPESSSSPLLFPDPPMVELSVDMQRKFDNIAADFPPKQDAAIARLVAVKPAKPRKLLVYMETTKNSYYHDSIPYCARALLKIGEQTGAWEATLTDDSSIWTPATLAKYDGIFMDNTTGEHPKTDEGKKALLDYVKAGHGFSGVHAATDCNHTWAEYQDLIGGEFMGHPYFRVSVKNEDPKNPINAAFDGKGFAITEEIYTFKLISDKRPEGYSRDKLHVLYSIDMDKSGVKDTTRLDGDYALAWTRTYGDGRVFYSAFGHDKMLFANPVLLQHYLAGIQYSLGDIEADATPSAKLKVKPDIIAGPDLGAGTKTINVR